jgi:hypothetical protein
MSGMSQIDCEAVFERRKSSGERAGSGILPNRLTNIPVQKTERSIEKYLKYYFVFENAKTNSLLDPPFVLASQIEGRQYPIHTVTPSQ